MQILPGIYLINGSPYGRHQNGYLLHHHETTFLIDSGDLEDAPCLSEIEVNAARWGFRLEQASHLFVTHAHFDHASHAAALQRRGVRVVASRETAAAMAAGDDRCIGYAVHRQFDACQPDVIVEDGQEVDVGDIQVKCLAAPGHAQGMMVFEIQWAGETCWFTGDLLQAVHAHRGVDLPWTGGPDFDRQTYVHSLARLLHLRCDHLFPGHGPAGIGNGTRIIEMAYTRALQEWR